ncbi:MAG: glucoamylase family protein [Bacteroidota bacterium]
MKKLLALLIILGTSFSISQPLSPISPQDSTFLRMVQRKAFDFFWNEANPANGLIKDRSATWSPASIASVGFGLSSICVASDYNWVTREAAADRVLTTLLTFWTGPQGYAASGTIGRLGWFYHFLTMDTKVREWKSELSTIDSGLLLAGIIHAQQYFDGPTQTEKDIRAYADSIYRRVNFDAARNNGIALNMGWHPETGWLNQWWIGYNEGMIIYIMALGSPTYPIDPSLWDSWTSGYNFSTYYGYQYVNFPPLFGHQYSHCWVDFRGIRDKVMSGHGLDYFENSRRATLAQRAYSKANPGGFKAYSDSIWGITASDVQGGYAARGAPPAQGDDGTINPTAPGGSIAFAPQEGLQALKAMYNNYCVGTETRLWGPYGFRDAFNPQKNWFGTDYIGIDQGPIVLMIENYFTQRVWNTFMKSPYIQLGLQRAGFQKVTGVEETKTLPEHFVLSQNYPNPFNPSTMITYELPHESLIRMTVHDVLGREVETLVNGTQSAGVHQISFTPGTRALSSGVYFYTLTTEQISITKRMILVK